MTATITYVGSRVRLETPYNPLLVDDLRTIPSGRRSWEPETKTWVVYSPWVPQAVEMVLVYFPDAEIVGTYQEPWEAYEAKREENLRQKALNDLNAYWTFQVSTDQAATPLVRNVTYVDGAVQFGPWRIDESRKTSQGPQKGPGTTGRGSDDYSVLGVTPDAPGAVIDAAYKALMRLYHPDTNTDPDATQKAQAVNAAYERLRPKKGR